jgi:predicted CopG family antitoxin
MGERNVTSAQIKVETWEELNGLKRPGDSMDDVIQRLIESHKQGEGNADGAESVPA